MYCASTFTRSDTTIGKVFKLTKDINMEGIDWEPWCNDAQYFEGTFDGQEHTISNLKISGEHEAEDGYAVGFIGRLGSNGGTGAKSLKNVTFKDAEVTGNHYVAVAVGYNEFGKVENVHVVGSKVTATHANNSQCGDKAGALIGQCGSNGTYIVVNNCSATNCEVKAARDAAQLIGYGYANNTYTNLSATNVTVTGVAGECEHDRAGTVSQSLVGNGTEAGLSISQ